MSVILNDPLCAALGANTGTPGCAFNPKTIVGAMLIDKDKVFLAASDLVSTATFISAVQTLCLAGTGTRVYPIFRFDSVADNTEDVSIKTLGYGGKSVAKEGKYDFTFEMSQGGLCHNNKLRSFNGIKDKKVIFFDKDYNVLAVKSGTAGDITGFTLDFIYAYPVKIDDGENPANYRLRFALANVREMNEDLAYFNLGANPESTFKGNLDVELYNIAQEATKVTIGIRTQCDKVSLYDVFSTDLDDLALWTVTKAGAAVTPTGVVAVPAVGPKGEGGWQFTLTTPSGAHVFTLDPPAALAAATVGGVPDEGYEATGTLTVTF